eukprot:SAG22_NODE_1_length_62449_cov_158.689270_1_plen_222_part_00
MHPLKSCDESFKNLDSSRVLLEVSAPLHGTAVERWPPPGPARGARMAAAAAPFFFFSFTFLAASCSADAAALAPPALDRLPAGAIQPAGWLKAQAELQGNGMSGALGFWGGGISASLWMPGNARAKKKVAGLQGSGYYLNGMIPLSCQADLPRLRQLRDESVEHILNITTSEDGFLGPSLGNGSAHFQKDPDDYWGRMSVVLGLQSFCECQGPYAPPKVSP